jgi:transcriptional regulator with XRE-family HTH domain
MSKASHYNLSQKIRELREQKSLSQEKLARFADVSNNTIVNIEAGIQKNSTIDTLRKIANALDVSIEHLIK